MVSLDDQLYIQRVLDGNTSSFTSLVEKYKDMVFTVCYRILRQKEDAEDASQQAFIKAYRNLHAFEGKSKFSTWLYTIAYRTAISSSRLKQAAHNFEPEPVDWSENDPLPAMEHISAQERRTFVRQAIDTLPEIDSALISLYYLDECSVQEIVEITGLNESNVKVRLHRSRKQLKSSLEQLLRHEMNSIL